MSRSLGLLLAAPQSGDVSVTDARFEFLNAPPLWVVILVILPVVLLGVSYIYRREAQSASFGAKSLLAALRISAILLILLVLFQPVNRSQVFSVNRSVIAFLIDESASMDRQEEYDEELSERLSDAAGLLDLETGGNETLDDLTRAELIKRVLSNPASKPLEALEQKVDVRYFAFDQEVRPLMGPDEAASEGEATAIGEALLTSMNELRHRNLSGIVLVTDGQSNRGRDPLEVARMAGSEGIPIHTVGVGNPAEPRNIAVIEVNAPDVALVGDQVAVETSMVAQGYSDEPAELIIKDRKTGEVLDSRGFSLVGSGRQQTETLYFKAEREGDFELEVAVPVKSGEQFTDDNRRIHHLRVDPEVINVLYVEGRPRWEYRYLKNLLLRADNFKVQCLLVSAAADFIQESTAGVPFLIKFPPNRKELFEYDVIILGDVAPDQIEENPNRTTGDLLRELHEFVTFGGGLVMVAGQLHSPRDYRDSGVGDLLPVEVGSPEESEGQKADRGPFRPRMLDPLAPHPIVRLETDIKKNRDLLEDEAVGLPPMRWYAAVSRAKPGADVILQHPSNGNQYGPHVLMAATRIGRGRSLYIGFDETWLWRNPYGDRYTERFWRAAVRHVAIGKLRSSDRRFDLRTDKENYILGEPIEVSVRVFDEDFRASRNERQMIRLERADRPVEELIAHKKEDGFFERTLRADIPGTYRLWVEDPAQGDKRLSPRTVEVQIPRLEILTPTLDRNTLTQIADSSSGRYYGLDEFGLLVENMRGQSRRIPVRTEQRDLWDRGWVILLAIGLLALEWALRKRVNLL